jgi:uncharacterized protein
MFLPDINLWLALAFDFHVHHAPANAWFLGISSQTCFCRYTQQGFLRLATNPSVFKNDVVSLKHAWQMYDTIVTDPRVAFADEPQDVERYWRQFTQRRSISPKLWGDAYLAAFARASDLQIVTFDKALSQFRDVDCAILS